MGRVVAVFLLLFVAQAALAQSGPQLHIKWFPVTTQEDGTVVDPADISYVVYDKETGIPICATQDIECRADIGWGQCITMYATAKQISTSLESDHSNEVRACGGVRPDFPLSAPVIEVVIENSAQE